LREENSIDASQQQRRPRRRAEHLNMPAAQIGDDRSAADVDNPADDGRGDAQSASTAPESGEISSQKKVQHDQTARRPLRREQKVQPVRRIEQRRLRIAKERGAAEVIRIPQRKMPGADLIEREFPPVEILDAEIGSLRRRNAMGNEKRIAEEDEAEDGHDSRQHPGWKIVPSLRDRRLPGLIRHGGDYSGRAARRKIPAY
jgi:hypothetical protein